MKYPFIWLIKCYRKFISPLTGPSCRFYPTCSSYGLEAFEKHGAFKGFFMTIFRIGKCHPFHPGGYDPVPEKWPSKKNNFSAVFLLSKRD